MSASGELAGELERLVQQLWAASPSHWTEARIAAARTFALALVDCAGQAGAPPPADIALPTVAPWALADQLAVLGRELLTAPTAERATAQALSHLAEARSTLLGSSKIS